jgi:DMSO reductase anchor subunit
MGLSLPSRVTPVSKVFRLNEVLMPAYLLLIAALLSRVVPHSGWFGFTAVGGSLLYFGARRNWRELLLPVAALGVVDYYLTTHVYAYDFVWQAYLVTWTWYAAALVLGRILLSKQVSVLRVASAAILGPTSFFLASNYAVWAGSHFPGGMYAPGAGGLLTCLVAGLPFYGKDLISTGLVVTLAFGVPVVIRRFRENGSVAHEHTL